MPQSFKDNQLAPALRTVITRLIKKLRAQASMEEQLSMTERSTIALLDQHGALLPSELAGMEKITTQSMSQVLNHLLELGYITRTASKTDKRKTNISLSKTGRAVLYKVRDRRDEWLSSALQTCSAQEQDILRRALVPLTKLVDFD
jgi:DNA-binding MarR family transcriptional regulator